MYGQNAGVLRESLRELLTFHRIQHRIGGAGPRHVPATTTAEERELIGAQIARYRHSVLTWCHQGLYAANPHIDPKTLTRRTRGPVDELHHRLGIALGSDHAGLPTLEELTTTRPFRLVELWRHAARACALGEHDFTAGAGYGKLSKAQALTLVHDVAEVTEALLALDRRYDGIPGWQHLTNPTRLARAAEACATYSRYSDPSYSIDHLGWAPPPSSPTGQRCPVSPVCCRRSTTSGSTCAPSPTPTACAWSSTPNASSRTKQQGGSPSPTLHALPAGRGGA